MADRLLLAVEGPDDKHVLWAILARHHISAHLTKAVIHTWLAWQDDPGTPLGQAITKRYFDSDGPHVGRLLAWLTRLYA